jgi:hypothetical protein
MMKTGWQALSLQKKTTRYQAAQGRRNPTRQPE